MERLKCWTVKIDVQHAQYLVTAKSDRLKRTTTGEYHPLERVVVAARQLHQHTAARHVEYLKARVGGESKAAQVTAERQLQQLQIGVSMHAQVVQ